MIDELAELRAEVAKWKALAETAAHYDKGDKVGFDWSVLTALEEAESIIEWIANRNRNILAFSAPRRADEWLQKYGAK